MNDSWDVKSVRHSGQYESCMKINGIPLLPPVLSKQCRQEMQYYKLLAKEVEKRLQFLKQEECEVKENENAPEHIKTETDTDNSLKEIELDIYDSPQKETPVQCNNLSSVHEKCKKETDMINDKPSLNTHEQQQSESNIPEQDNTSKNKTCSTATIYKNSHHSRTFDFSDLYHCKTSPNMGNKSFTGSLGDLHKELSESTPKLTRQNSYLVLEPSPHLIAHLTEKTLNTGIEMTAISMSESLSDISQMCKKRRNWDLENAKVKWSKMALSLSDGRRRDASAARKLSGAKSLASKTFVMKNENHKSPSISKDSPSKPKCQNFMEPLNTSSPFSTAPSSPRAPAAARSPRVRDLYDRVQRQQAAQMAALVDKQKKEQELLKKVFEDQNALFLKQLQSVCPLSPVGVKTAWAEQEEGAPVSLKDLPDARRDPLWAALADTSDYIRQCDDVLRQSRDVTSSLKKPARSRRSESGARSSPRRSPRRRITYESGSERETGAATDRTGDTLADLNVTLPTDDSAPSAPSAPAAHAAHAAHTDEEHRAASVLAAAARGYLTRRLLRTARVRRTVRTIADALRCALELHVDTRGLAGNDVELHRRLIQQITAACYSLHETFVTSSPAERCAAIAADRELLRGRSAAGSRSLASVSGRAATAGSRRSRYEALSDFSRSLGAGRRAWR